VTRDSVVELLARLINQLQQGAPGWENTTLEAYLDALAGWLSSAEGYYRNDFGSGSLVVVARLPSRSGRRSPW
jgi:hypothetical protein